MLKDEEITKGSTLLATLNEENFPFGMHKDLIDDLHRMINKALEINEKFTIGFADWLEKLSPSQRVSLWSKNGEHSGLFTMDNEQLLNKYKKSLKKQSENE